MRFLRILTGGVFLLFLTLITLTLFTSSQSALETKEHILHTSFSGDIITLSPDAPEAIHEAPWDDFGDTIARLASEALLPLLAPSGTTFFIAPRPGTTAPLPFPEISPFHPCPCDGVWIECPSIFDPRETELFQSSCLAQWAQALSPKGLFICDLDARGRSPAIMQHRLKSLTEHFPFVSLWSTSLQRWQLIASPSPLLLDPCAIETRFRQKDLAPIFLRHAIETPWPLFASAISNDCTNLTAIPVAPTSGALGLIATFGPYIDKTLTCFTTPAPIASYRAERKAFYDGETSLNPSLDPLHLSLATLDYALAQDYVAQGNTLAALNCCQSVLQRAIPSIEQAIFILDLALHHNAEPTLQAMFTRLASCPISHPDYPEAFRAQYQAYLRLNDIDACLALLNTPNALTPFSPQEQTFYTCEALFLAAQHAPSREALKHLHNYLRFHPSETLRLQMFKRYGELLNTYGDARTPLRFLSAYTEQHVWPDFETLFEEKHP